MDDKASIEIPFLLNPINKCSILGNRLNRRINGNSTIKKIKTIKKKNRDNPNNK